MTTFCIAEKIKNFLISKNDVYYLEMILNLYLKNKFNPLRPDPLNLDGKNYFFLHMN